MSSNKKILLQVGNIVGFIITVIVNALANILPINGKNTGELSDAIPNLFVPAGFIFSIWGVIYVLLGVFSIYQTRNEEYLEKVGIYFIISSAANSAWILAWHYQQIALSLVLMFVIFASLLAIYLRVGIGKEKAEMKEVLGGHLPFSVYIGWITVATVANVTAVLVTYNWDRFGLSETLWTVLVIIVLIVIVSLVLLTRKDIAYSLVAIWASYGIYVKQATNVPEVALTALVAIIVITTVIIVSIILKLKKK